LCSGPIFGIFTDNPEIIALGKQIMLIDIALEFGRSVNLVVIRGLQAAGDIKFPVVLGIGSMWGVAALLSYVLGISLGWGLIGVWIAMALDECLRAIVVYTRWKKGSWRGKALVL
ncbi:MAG: MATE family efflux transporter, partial [Cellulosilyticaceae bacterium]